jgi:hypothetical protein
MADYYRRYFERRGRADELEQVQAAVWDDLLAAERQGREAGFFLHVLISVRFPLEVRIAGAEAVRRLTRVQRSNLLRGLRTLRTLGVSWLEEMLGSEKGGRAFLQEVGVLLQTLERRVVIDTPSFRLGQYTRPLTPRQRMRRLLDGAILCLLHGLQGTDKAVETVTVWLEKFGLLPARQRRGASAIEFVKKRAQRAQARVRGPAATASPPSGLATPTGYVADLLTTSYEGLREHLLLSEGMRDGSIWEEQARQWGTTGTRVQQAFRAFCRDRSFSPDAGGWRRFGMS